MRCEEGAAAAVAVGEEEVEEEEEDEQDEDCSLGYLCDNRALLACNFVQSKRLKCRRGREEAKQLVDVSFANIAVVVFRFHWGSRQIGRPKWG